jgi:hypothetical protein
MGVQFNIKDAEIKALAEDVGARLGISAKEAVREALRAKLKTLTRDERIARVHQLVEEMQPFLSKEFLEAEDPTAFLYDEETGLPI